MMRHSVEIAEVAGQARDSAAPTGGALSRGRGCLIPLSQKAVATVCAALSLTSIAVPGVAHADTHEPTVVKLADPGAIDVPSGRNVTLHEVLSEPDGLYRARFVAPDLDVGAGDLDVLTDDAEALCAEVVLPLLDAAALDAARVVVSLSAEPVPFGVAAPEVAQTFESFRIGDEACIWEAF